MASVNKVILVGNLGKDPELRYLPDGSAVAGVSIATTESWKGKSGEKQEKTEWHRVSFFGKLAEIAGQYLKKALRCTLRAASRRVSGRTRRGRTGTPRKSWRTACRCCLRGPGRMRRPLKSLRATLRLQPPPKAVAGSMTIFRLPQYAARCSTPSERIKRTEKVFP